VAGDSAAADAHDEEKKFFASVLVPAAVPVWLAPGQIQAKNSSNLTRPVAQTQRRGAGSVGHEQCLPSATYTALISAVERSMPRVTRRRRRERGERPRSPPPQPLLLSEEEAAMGAGAACAGRVAAQGAGVAQSAGPAGAAAAAATKSPRPKTSPSGHTEGESRWLIKSTHWSATGRSTAQGLAAPVGVRTAEAGVGHAPATDVETVTSAEMADSTDNARCIVGIMKLGDAMGED
jgi:hypothetical protein